LPDLPPHVDTRRNPGQDSHADHVDEHGPRIIQQGGLLKSTSGVRSTEEMIPSKSLVLGQKTAFVNEVDQFSRGPEVEQVNVQAILVGLVRAKRSFQSGIRNDSFADPAWICVGWHWEVVGAIKSHRPLRAISAENSVEEGTVVKR